MNTIDLTKVAETIEPKTERLSYQNYKHLFTKVAFDVFQLNNSPVESYWLLEKGEDGGEYLVANYGKELTDVKENALEVKSSWEALSDKESKNITVYYKGTPIRRMASIEYGFTKRDVSVFKTALVNKLSSDEGFVKKLVGTLPSDKRSAISQVFPELKRFSENPDSNMAANYMKAIGEEVLQILSKIETGGFFDANPGLPDAMRQRVSKYLQPYPGLTVDELLVNVLPGLSSSMSGLEGHPFYDQIMSMLSRWEERIYENSNKNEQTSYREDYPDDEWDVENLPNR